MKDNINPSHYQQYGCQTIEVTRRLGFNLGNVFKYISRSPFKGTEEEDLKKAMWYLKDHKTIIESNTYLGGRSYYQEEYQQIRPTLIKYLKPIKDKKLADLLLSVVLLHYFWEWENYHILEEALIEYSGSRASKEVSENGMPEPDTVNVESRSKLIRGEAVAIQEVWRYGRKYGYGNMIEILKYGWAEYLMDRHKMKLGHALHTAGLTDSPSKPYPCDEVFRNLVSKYSKK